MHFESTGRDQFVPRRAGSAARHLSPVLEPMEARRLLSFADGNGPVVTAITETPGSNQPVVTFDGPLNPGPAQDVANYQVTRALSNSELVTSERAGGENPVRQLQRQHRFSGHADTQE